MTRSVVKSILLAAAFFALGEGVAAQTVSRPLLQDIQVQREPAPTPTPLIKRTGSSSRADDVVAGVNAPISGVKTSIPILAETPIPGLSGVLVENLRGDVVIASGTDTPLNPASNVKIATTYAVLKRYGPNYRFSTNVWTDGSYDQATATIRGNLYITGIDPVFSYEDAINLANELNRIGIRSVQGDLFLDDSLVFNYGNITARSGQTLLNTMDAAKRPAAATRAWGSFRINSGKYQQLNEMPSVSFTGSAYVQPRPADANLLFSHQSAPLKDVVKVMMSYSNNFLSEKLGDMAGGPFGIARTVQEDTGSSPQEFYIQTASGLGINRVTATAMMRLLRTLRAKLGEWDMSLEDVMPVAGMDNGTLAGRFATDFSRGSVVGKTGTLGRTDGGVSALAGEIGTRNGRLLFVIFNQRGSVPRFRSFQNYYVSLIQGQFGGAAPIGYSGSSVDALLTKTAFAYPDSRPRIAGN
ncbi:MAG TPA: D-alanyl-D-alanine carboxypeptidase [Pyrinomonadaceae bacterium]|nr:D-alanyl-D-alanine carboxypeptidase [Pyrinomonadaceae bacterium]